MDYVVGSVAALISGNVTPSRPKAFKRALTPTKHQPSPNVTPKSEMVTDRSIFLSPTMQKKKAIVKKSPKRIFQNPDLDVTNENDDVKASPKADKVKKHLKDDLDTSVGLNINTVSPKLPKNNINKSTELTSPKKKLKMSVSDDVPQEVQENNESTPKKKKKKNVVDAESAVERKLTETISTNEDKTDTDTEMTLTYKGPTKKKRLTNIIETVTSQTVTGTVINKKLSKNQKKKLKNANKKNANMKPVDSQPDDKLNSSVDKGNVSQSPKKKKRNKKAKKAAVDSKSEIVEEESAEDANMSTENINDNYVNPNAVTNQDTDSEHESDDDIMSDNEENNKSVLDTGPQDSSDEEEEEPPKKNKKEKKHKVEIAEKEVPDEINSEEEIKRTLFVGNVPFSNKCKKEIKNIFSKYGDIDTIRIRTVPVKDARVTPKLAVIKNELHPDRSTVNVYIKYADPSSVDQALVENNTVLNEHHLRVARSDVTGAEHDPKCSVFVGNIPFALEDEGLRAKFHKCGEIVSVRIVRDKKTNAGKGFGYVNFASKDGVELALALTEEDLTIKNRILRIKRCTQPTTNKTKQSNQRNNQRGNQGFRQGNQGNRQGNQGNREGNQGNRQGNQVGRNDRFGGNKFGRNDRFGGNDKFGRNDRMGGNKFVGNSKFQGQRRPGQSQEGQAPNAREEGAYRRIMNKRKNTDASDGPPNKIQKNTNQRNNNKKTRKEFVGMTAEKKKFQKRKFDKGQKKKKALSEILTK